MKKTPYLHMRITDDQQKTIDAVTEQLGFRSRSDMVRFLVMEKARELGIETAK